MENKLSKGEGVFTLFFILISLKMAIQSYRTGQNFWEARKKLRNASSEHKEDENGKELFPCLQEE